MQRRYFHVFGKRTEKRHTDVQFKTLHKKQRRHVQCAWTYHASRSTKHTEKIQVCYRTGYCEDKLVITYTSPLHAARALAKVIVCERCLPPALPSALPSVEHPPSKTPSAASRSTPPFRCALFRASIGIRRCATRLAWVLDIGSGGIAGCKPNAA